MLNSRNCSTLNVALFHLCRTMDIPTLSEYLRLMLKEPSLLPCFFFNMIQTYCSSSVVPVTHAVLLKAFLDFNKVDDAFHLFNAMLYEGFKPDKDCFAKLATALCADGRMDEAVSAYRDIVMKHPHSDVHLDNQIPIMIMTELINSGMNDKAATVFTLANGSQAKATYIYVCFISNVLITQFKSW
ncbi:PPR superfamily protein [Medicago truncatula]|uniref:PPR superfamily protein n=1 Tax=Medicago truncatula TaxID=3880 RepID=G7KXR4_MEDTR|nr:PPR superfamily protein [Medicago truncatula]